MAVPCATSEAALPQRAAASWQARALKSAISSRGAAAILPGIGLVIAVELRQTICSSRLEKRSHSKNSQYEMDRHGCIR